MAISGRYTSADLELLPDIEGVRYEIIDGDLHVTRQPHAGHQYTTSAIASELHQWSRESGTGLTLVAPGLVFSADNDVAPDLVWVSMRRLRFILDESGHLSSAPELVVEILSPGARNVRRDRQLKLDLYSRQGVDEYWIADWRARIVEIYRRHQAALRLVETLRDGDLLTSPLLPGFSCFLSDLWGPIPPGRDED